MTRELARGLRYSVPISLCMWLAGIGIVLLCSADFADRAHRHEGRNGRIALELR